MCSVVVRAKLNCGLRDCEQSRWFTLVFRISLFFFWRGGVGTSIMQLASIQIMKKDEVNKILKGLLFWAFVSCLYTQVY